MGFGGDALVHGLVREVEAMHARALSMLVLDAAVLARRCLGGSAAAGADGAVDYGHLEHGVRRATLELPHGTAAAASGYAH